MRNMHRIITILILFAFVPAALAAGHMRLCVGDDGHRAIEFVHSPHAVGHVASEPGESDPGASETLAANVAEDGGCVDFLLVTEAISAPSIAKAKYAPPAHQNGDAALPAGVPTAHREAITQARFSVPRFEIDDGRLDALKTVVLLI